jgi:hypothetical protein
MVLSMAYEAARMVLSATFLGGARLGVMIEGLDIAVSLLSRHTIQNIPTKKAVGTIFWGILVWACIQVTKSSHLVL